MNNTLTTYEDKLNYLVTLVESGKKIDWDYAVKRLGLKMNPDSLRKAFNTTQFSGYNVYKYMLDKQHENCDTTELQKLQELQDAIFKERVKLQDANREKNKYLREQSRTEIIIDEMKHLIENMKPFNYRQYNYKYGTNLEASVLLSDLHYGITVDNSKNIYDETICELRLNQLRDKVVERCKEHKVDKLNVCILGDDISGLIHFSTIAENNRDVITQCIEVSELLSHFVMQLREKIPEVKVFSTYGNHSRSWQGKSNGSNKENYERIVAEFLRLRLQPYGIEVVDSGCEDFIKTTIANKTIIMTHGDKDSLTQATANFTKLFREPIDEIYMGHLHAHKEFDDCNTQVIINGSLVSTDDYALSLRRHTDAVQLLRIYGEDVCCYRLKLN